MHLLLIWIQGACLIASAANASEAFGPGAKPPAGPGFRVSADASIMHIWRSVPGLGPVEELTDIAATSDGRRVAVADLRGVLVGSPGPAGSAAAADASGGAEPLRFRRVTRPGLTRRVRFDDRGALWAAGEKGLFRIDASGVEVDATPGVGQAGRATIALDIRGEWFAAGTAEGAFAGRRRAAGPIESGPIEWVRIRGGLAPGGVTDVALGPPSRSGARPLWLVSAGRLHLVWLRPTGDGVSASSARALSIVGGPLGDPVRRVVVTGGPGDVAVLYRRAVARAIGAPLEPGGEVGLRWEVGFPVLPPGAEITDIEATRGVVWLASSSGLLRGERLTGPYRRAASPAGSRAIRAVAADAGGRLFSATRAQLLRGEPQRRHPVRTVMLDRMPRDPALRQVHVRALSMLRLETRRTDALWRGVGRRGWWPSLSVRGGIDYGSDRRRFYDETFSFGQLNRLNDRTTDRSIDYDADIALSWDLGEIAYSSEAVDLSRESRQVIGLRDNVLDEINQLYFDRQRALRALSAFADWSDPEADALRLRALELAAGLDGWTGGWFSSQVEIAPAARGAWSRPLAPAGPALARPPPTWPLSHPETPVPANPHERREKS